MKGLLKKYLAAAMSTAVLLSSAVSLVAGADSESTYQYYIAKHDDFNASSDGAAWDSSSLNTDIVGIRTITGTKNGANVTGTVNIGEKEYIYYEDFENKTTGDTPPRSANDQIVLTANADQTNGLITYQNFGTDNKALQIALLKDSAGNEQRSSYVNYKSQSLKSGQYSFAFDFAVPENLSSANDDNTYYNGCIIDAANDKIRLFQILLRYKVAAQQFQYRLMKYDGSTSPQTDGGWTVMDHVRDNDVALEFVLDTNAKTWDLYADGKALVTGKTLINSGYPQGSLSDDEYANYTASSFRTFGFRPVGMYRDAANGSAAYHYIDNFRVSDLSSDKILYYKVPGKTSYDFDLNSGAQVLALDTKLPLVYQDGAASGYSMRVKGGKTHRVDTSYPGIYSFSDTADGFDEPIVTEATVWEDVPGWSENFQGYTQEQLGKAPQYEPYVSGCKATGATVELDPADSSNQVLKYTADSEFAQFSSGTLARRAKVSYRIKLGAVPTDAAGNLSMPLYGYVGETTALAIETNLATKPNGTARLQFTQYSTPYDTATKTTAYMTSQNYDDGLDATDWITISYVMDFEKDAFQYKVTQGEKTWSSDTWYPFLYRSDSFYRLDFADRTKSGSNFVKNVTLYVDDINVIQPVTVKEAKTIFMTVYQGDSVTLPVRADVLLTDDKTIAELPVTWSGNLDTQTLGMKQISGTAAGCPTPVMLTAKVTDKAYQIGEAVLKNGEADVFGLVSGGKLTGAEVLKISDETKPAQIYAALYDAEDVLITVSTGTISGSETWEQGTKYIVPVELNIPARTDIDSCKLKIFLWDNTQRPLAEKKVVTNGAVSGSAPTLWVAGDSLAACYRDAYKPETGWGEMLPSVLKSSVYVQNGSAQGGLSGTGGIGGQSSKSYVDEGRLDKIVSNAKAGDYLFISFGHNDSHPETYRHTEPGDNGTYKTYLETFVSEARANGMIPVLVTPVCRRKFDSAGNLTGNTNSQLDEYAATMRKVAAENRVALIDIFAKTETWLTELGEEGSRAYYLYLKGCTGTSDDDCVNIIGGVKKHALWCSNYPDGKDDTTHMNMEGARQVADWMAEAIRAMKLPLENYLQ